MTASSLLKGQARVAEPFRVEIVALFSALAAVVVNNIIMRRSSIQFISLDTYAMLSAWFWDSLPTDHWEPVRHRHTQKIDLIFALHLTSLHFFCDTSCSTQWTDVPCSLS